MIHSIDSTLNADQVQATHTAPSPTAAKYLYLIVARSDAICSFMNCLAFRWLSWWPGSNRRHPSYEDGVLPLNYTSEAPGYPRDREPAKRVPHPIGARPAG